MFGHFPHLHSGEPGMPPRFAGQVTGPPGHWRSLLATADRACCCPALPAVVVIVPPGPGRLQETDLLLCRHHFRASQEALAAIGAVVFDPGDIPEAPERPDEAEPMTAAGR